VRFKTKINWIQLVAFCTIESLYLFDLPSALHGLSPRIPLAIIFGGLTLVFCLIALSVYKEIQMFTEYYEVQEGDLFLSEGREKTLVPYSNLEKLLPISANFGPFASNQILVRLVKGKDLRIAVAEKERFLAEVSKRCPQMEQRETRLGPSLQRPLPF
jgi:hypothetical protein